MKRILYLFAFLLSVCSCKSPKNAESNSLKQLSNLIESKFSQVDSTLTDVVINQKKTNEKVSNMKTESKTVYYSLPDSSGKQYPVVVNDTKSSKDEKENSYMETELKQSVMQLSTKVQELSEKLDEVMSSKEKTVEMSWWDRNKSIIYVIITIIVVSAFAYVFYRIKKIIK